MENYNDKKILELEIYFNERVTTKKEDLKYGLPQWYEGIRKKRVSELSIGDLAKMIRQDIFVDAIILLCLEKIIDNPLVGFMYDGELLGSIANYIKKDYWENSENLKAYAISTYKSIEKRIDYILMDLELEEERKEYIDNVNKLKKNLMI